VTADPVALARRVTGAFRELSALFDAAGPTEREAVRRLYVLVMTWSIEARRIKN
jgi:hypothetical protein